MPFAVCDPFGFQSGLKFLAEIVHQTIQLGKMIHERFVVSWLIRSKTKSSKKLGAIIRLTSMRYSYTFGPLIPN